MSYFLESLKSKSSKIIPSTALNKLVSIKPHKWIVYKDTLNNLSLISLDKQAVCLSYFAPSTNQERQDTLSSVNGVMYVYDEAVWEKLMESIIGKGNNYLYFEYGKSMQSRKIPLRKSKIKEETICTSQKTTLE